MQEFLQQVLSGLATGAIFASLALALVLIYNAMGLVNFAQGEMAMFATFIAYTLISRGLSYWIAFPVTLVLAFGGPLLTEGLGNLTKADSSTVTILQNAFLPGSYPASLLYAAIFALSPSLLISRLQQAGAGMQKNLSGSSAGDGGGKSNNK